MPIFGKNSERSSEDELLQKGAAAFNAQQWDRASEHLRALVDKNPQHTLARAMLVGSLLQEKKADEAFEHTRYLLKVEPQNARFHAALGLCFQLKDKTDEAILAYRRSLELEENPMIRGAVCILKTPDIPLVNIETVDKSAASILARTLSSLSPSRLEGVVDEKTVSKISGIGDKLQDDIMAGKEHAKFLKEVADACFECDAYVGLKDLLRKFDTIDQLKEHLQLLDAETGIKGRFAKYEHLDFVQFEKA